MNTTKRHDHCLAGLLAGLLLLLCLVLAGCTAASAGNGTSHAPDWYMVSACGQYKPVSVPGTQRRYAQQEAVEKARRQIYEHIGSMKTANGKTVNDVLVGNARLRAEILNAVRTAELLDWKVTPECGKVDVWVRIDMNRVRAILASANC